jgi:hypothetical protein
MTTKREEPTVKELLAELRREVREGFASMSERLDQLEQIAQRPRVARVIHDPARPENGGA